MPQAQESSWRGLAVACVPGHGVYTHHARLHSPGPQEGTGNLAVPVPNPKEEGVARHGLRASRALRGEHRERGGGQAHLPQEVQLTPSSPRSHLHALLMRWPGGGAGC